MNKQVKLILGNYANQKSLTNLVESCQEPFCTFNRARTTVGGMYGAPVIVFGQTRTLTR